MMLSDFTKTDKIKKNKKTRRYHKILKSVIVFWHWEKGNKYFSYFYCLINLETSLLVSDQEYEEVTCENRVIFFVFFFFQVRKKTDSLIECIWFCLKNFVHCRATQQVLYKLLSSLNFIIKDFFNILSKKETSIFLLDH